MLNNDFSITVTYENGIDVTSYYNREQYKKYLRGLSDFSITDRFILRNLELEEQQITEFKNSCMMEKG